MEYVLVTEEWLAKAKTYGSQRNALNGGNDTPAYAHTGRLPYSSLTASRLAVVAEVGAHFYFGVDPESTVFVVDRTEANYEALRASADLMVNGWNVEVRNSARTTSPLPIKEKDNKPNKIVVQAHVEMEPTETGGSRPTGRVFFLGWRYGTDYVPWRAKAGTSYMAIKNDVADLKKVLATAPVGDVA